MLSEEDFTPFCNVLNTFGSNKKTLTLVAAPVDYAAAQAVYQSNSISYR